MQDPDTIFQRLLEKEGIDLEEFITDMRSVIKEPSGRTFLWMILSRSGVFQAEYLSAPGAMAYAAGARSVGVFLLEMLEYLDKDALAMMRNDAKVRTINNRNENKEEGNVADVYEPPDDDADGGGEH